MIGKRKLVIYNFGFKRIFPFFQQIAEPYSGAHFDAICYFDTKRFQMFNTLFRSMQSDGKVIAIVIPCSFTRLCHAEFTAAHGTPLRCSPILCKVFGRFRLLLFVILIIRINIQVSMYHMLQRIEKSFVLNIYMLRGFGMIFNFYFLFYYC